MRNGSAGRHLAAAAAAAALAVGAVVLGGGGGGASEASAQVGAGGNLAPAVAQLRRQQVQLRRQQARDRRVIQAAVRRSNEALRRVNAVQGGPAGPSGPAGPPGPPGEHGLRGDQGAPGPAGIASFSSLREAGDGSGRQVIASLGEPLGDLFFECHQDGTYSLMLDATGVVGHTFADPIAETPALARGIGFGTDDFESVDTPAVFMMLVQAGEEPGSPRANIDVMAVPSNGSFCRVKVSGWRTPAS